MKKAHFTLLLLLPVALCAQSKEQEYSNSSQKTEIEHSVSVKNEKKSDLPSWNIKTNLLQDAVTSINLAVEFRAGRRTSIDLPVTWNPFSFGGNRKWKHILVQPEFRWWTREVFSGFFWGVHAHYAYYNVSRVSIYPFNHNYRYEGWGAGAGLSLGYRWNFNSWLGMEATLGLGYAYMDYDRFECQHCGKNLAHETKHYFGPTKVGLNLIFGIKGKKKDEPMPLDAYRPANIHADHKVTSTVVVASLRDEIAVPDAIVIYEPNITASFITPATEAVKTRSEAGMAYLDFASGQAEVIPSYSNNAAELQKIGAVIESVKSNPDAKIVGVSIVGHASPEGSFMSNLLLSEGRAKSLQRLIVALSGLDESLFTARGSGEDWQTLEESLDALDMHSSHKASVRRMIRSIENHDTRERSIIGLGIPYRMIRRDIYPKLRRTDYTLDYTILPFTIEKGKEVMKTRPGNLSLNEIFLIANTYEPGSDAYNEAFETAAQVFPDSDVANINAAASALGRGDTVSATRYLSKVNQPNAEYHNNMGVLAWLQGDKTRSAQCFANAGAAGATNATELSKHVGSLPKN